MICLVVLVLILGRFARCQARARHFPSISQLKDRFDMVASLDARHFPSRQQDTADKSQSSRHIPCAFHLESWQKLACERHGGACLLLLSAVSNRSSLWDSIDAVSQRNWESLSFFSALLAIRPKFADNLFPTEH